MGWSHGGLIVLLEALAHPKDSRCVFAGVPVSDLVARMGYSSEEYRALFSAKRHIARDARLADIYRFLARHLSPPRAAK